MWSLQTNSGPCTRKVVISVTDRLGSLLEIGCGLFSNQIVDHVKTDSGHCNRQIEVPLKKTDCGPCNRQIVVPVTDRIWPL